MDQWSSGQVLAVYDLCQMISATLMARHEEQLLEKMIECDERRIHNCANCEHNLSLPFDESF